MNTEIPILSNNEPLLPDSVPLVASFHDEVVVVSDDPDSIQEKLQKAIEMTNEKLQLNVPLGIDVQVGKAYADVH